MMWALDEVSAGMAVSHAARLFNVPRNTLGDRAWVLAYANAVWRKRNPSEDVPPLGKKWWHCFQRRHAAEITMRTLDTIDRGRAACARKETVERSFDLLSSTLEEHVLLNQPSQIYNCDKTGFQMDGSSFDGHKSHFMPEVTEAAKREGVVLLCLPSHCSHILQPLDMRFFGPLKVEFAKVAGILCHFKHSYIVNKTEFAKVFCHPYQR
ncbi:hypothetical protein MHYP_G00307490 [Metynnis hypsauchen]